MATITAAAGGGNWSAGGSWVGGVAPGSGDDVLLTVTSGAITIDGTSGSPNLCRSLDCTGYTSTLTQGATGVLNIGDSGGGTLKLVAGMTFAPNGSSTINFISTTTGNGITCAGKTLANVVFNGAGGGWTFQDTYVGGQTTTFTAGTVGTGNQTCTCASISMNGGTWNLGSSTVTWSNTWGYNSGTIGAGTSTVSIPSATGNTFQGGGQTFYNLSFAQLVNGAEITFNSNFTVSNTLTMTGLNATTGRFLFVSSVAGTARTITANSVTASNIGLQDITGAGASGWNLSAITGNSGDFGGNSGITFTTPINCYMKTAASVNWSASNWFTTSGGSTTARVPLPQDTAIFDANSVTTTAKTITLDMSYLGSVNWTGIANNPKWAKTTACICYGSVTMVSGMTNSGTTNFTFGGRGSFNLTTGTQSITNPIIIDCLNGVGTLTQQDAITTSKGLTVTSGTLTGNSHAATFTSGIVNGGTFNTGGTLTLSSTLTASSGTLNASGNDINLTSAGATFSGATVNYGTLECTSLAISGGTVTAGGTTDMSTTCTISGTGNFSAPGQSVIGATTFSHSSTGTSTIGGLSLSSTFSHTAGTLSIGSGGVLCPTATISGSTTRTLNMGSGTWQLIGTGTVWTSTTLTGLTFNCQTSTILISNTSATTKTFAGNTLVYNNITVSGAASNGTVTFSGAFNVNGIHTLNPNCSIIFTKSTTYTLANISWIGAPSNLITIATNTAGTAATISCPNLVTCNYLSLKDSTAAGNVPFYAGPLSHSTNVSGNTNWVFTAGPINSVGTFTASAALAAVGVAMRRGAATFTSSAVLSAVGAIKNSQAATFSAHAILSPTGAAKNSQTATFTAHANLAAVGITYRLGVATFSSNSALAASSATGSFAAISAHSTLTAAGVAYRISAGTFAAAATLAVTGRSTARGVATFTAAAALIAAGRSKYSGTATFSPIAVLAAVAISTNTSTAVFSPAAHLAAVGAAKNQQVATFSSSSLLAAIGLGTHNSVGTFISSAILAGIGAAKASSIGTFHPVTVLAAIGAATSRSTATFSASASLAAVSRSTTRGAATFTPAAVLNARGADADNVVAIFSPRSDLAAAGASTARSSATFSASSALNVQSRSTARGVATFSASVSLAVVGRSTARSSATFSPHAILTAVGQETDRTAATFTAIATMTAVGTGFTQGSVHFTPAAHLVAVGHRASPTPNSRVLIARLPNQVI